MTKAKTILLLACLLPVIAFTQTTQEKLKQIRSDVRQTINGKEFYIHTVKKGQTLYMISKAYGIDINEVIKENPEVKQGIKAESKLRIPISDTLSGESTERRPLPPVKEPKPPQSGTEPARQDTISEPVPGSSSGAPCKEKKPGKNRVFKVALMLPLYLAEVAKIDPETLDRDRTENIPSLHFIEFYEGFRMAVDSLKKSGLNLKLFVYDICKDTIRTSQVLRKPEMKSMDLIIGFLYHRNFEIVAEFAKKNGICIVNPVSERSDLVNRNPFIFKVRPSRKTQIRPLAGFMEQAFYRAQIIIVRNYQYKDREAAEQLRKECARLKLTAQVVDGTDNAIGRLSRSKENVLVFFTENSTYILDLARKLSEIRNEYLISIVGLPDWGKIEDLETDYMVNLNAHIVAPYFIDYDDRMVKKFVKNFQDTFKTDPQTNAFLGFDVGYYFLTALMEYGHDFQNCISSYDRKALQTTFEFRQTKDNGFENQHWEIYKFENYKLVKVN